MSDYDDDLYNPYDEYLDDDGNPIYDLAAEYDDDSYSEEDEAFYDAWVESAAWEAYWQSPRGQLHKVVKRVKNHVDTAIRWVKWHNHKCKYCGKPATANGVICMDCDIPF